MEGLAAPPRRSNHVDAGPPYRGGYGCHVFLGAIMHRTHHLRLQGLSRPESDRVVTFPSSGARVSGLLTVRTGSFGTVRHFRLRSVAFVLPFSDEARRGDSVSQPSQHKLVAGNSPYGNGRGKPWFNGGNQTQCCRSACSFWTLSPR